MLARNQSNLPTSFFADALGKVQCTQMGIETYAQRCHQKRASDLHFHWELRVFADPLPFPLQLLDPKVMVIDSRATCLKVRERSDRRGKLPAWPSDATAMIRQIRHEIGHILTY